MKKPWFCRFMILTFWAYMSFLNKIAGTVSPWYQFDFFLFLFTVHSVKNNWWSPKIAFVMKSWNPRTNLFEWTNKKEKKLDIAYQGSNHQIFLEWKLLHIFLRYVISSISISREHYGLGVECPKLSAKIF